MTDASDTSGSDQLLDWIRQSQETFIKAVGAWTEMISKAVPTQAPETAEKGYDTITELVDQSFASAHRVVDAQQEFAHQVLRTAREVSTTTESALRSERQE